MHKSVIFTILVVLSGCFGWTPLTDNLERDEIDWWATQKNQFRLRQSLGALDRQGENMRLPRSLLPSDYYIELNPHIEVGRFTTDGYVEITVSCTSATSNISMNAAELTIDKKSIKVVDADAPTNQLQIVDSLYDEQTSREIITIPVSQPLTVGKQYKITMQFVASLNDALRGFYRSSYTEGGETKYLAVSQMEAPDARRAFPCFDEPNFKATFTITLARNSSWSSISNMPRMRTSALPGFPGFVRDHFQTSVKMSTYLVAMMVSEFVSVPSDTSLTKVEFNIWARPSFRNQTRYAGNIGPRVLKYFEYFFQIDYPLPKQDMAAIPDFAAGAMENWGLITYRESDLLFDEKRSSEAAKQRVAEVIAHELAHQWFGNLVTMEWWNVIWLNEGFARYMQYIGTHAVEPSFQMNDQFGIVTLHAVFQVDSLESSRPINYQVNTPDEINAMFDTISYNKGASIIRMCANFIGLETFQHGVTRYLNNKAYGNAVEDDLWQALQEQATIDRVNLPAPIKTIMDSWCDKMGFPLITVKRNYATGGAQISQQRFLLRKSGSSTDQTVYRWWVPLTYTGNFNEPQKSTWLTRDQDNVSVISLGITKDQWVIFNVEQVGYYRVMYDDTNFDFILDQLDKDHKAIPVGNRAQLIDDYLNIARASLIPYTNALDLTKYLDKERDYVPWTAASGGLDYIDTMMYEQPDVKEWQKYMAPLVTNLYVHVGFNENPSDSHLHIYTRSTAVNWACTKLDIQDCVTNAKTLFASWIANPNNDNLISPNLLRLITCTAIANGGQKEWDHGYQKYLASTLVNEKNDLLRAITCSRDTDIIYHMLEMMINSTSGIRLQDVNTFFTNIAANPVGNEIALDFLINRWDDVYKYLNDYAGFGGGSMPSLFRALCNRVNTPQKLTKLIKLRDDHMDVLGNSKTVQQGIEVAQANVDWVTKNYATIVGWLKSANSPTKPSSAEASTKCLVLFVLVLMRSLFLFE